MIDYNLSIAWQTAQTERTGKAINDLMEASKNIGLGSLYDRLVVLYNTPHWTEVDYPRLIQAWFDHGRRNATTKKGGMSKVMNRKKKVRVCAAVLYVLCFLKSY